MGLYDAIIEKPIKPKTVVIIIAILTFLMGFIIGGYIVGKKAGIYEVNGIYLHGVNVEVSGDRWIKALKTNNYLKINEEKELSLFDIQWLREKSWKLISVNYKVDEIEYIFKR